jgi:hypothetical protein
VTRPTCRFPTLGGLCDRGVAHSGDRCDEHRGLDPVEAAGDIAKAARARRATERRAVRARRDESQGDRAEVPMSDEQVAAVADCLNRHGVEYVIIGGGAAQLHGAPVMRTRDADVVPSKAAANLDRLAAALRELDARLWVGPAEPEGLAMPFDRGTLGQIEGFLNLITRYGPLDVTYRPDGTDGYDDLVRSAVTVRLLDVDVVVASLEDVIRSKEAAGRAKDIAALPDLIEHSRRRRVEPP